MGASTRFDLEGRVAIVTGAVRGIGAGVATALAEHGADVAVLDFVEAEEAEAVLSSIRRCGRRAWYLQQDLAALEELEDFVERFWEEVGCIDILVNNAGIAFLEHFDEITIEHWRRVTAVNADAVFFLSKHVAAKMIRSSVRGCIINTSSVNGLVAEACLAHYNASKGAVEMITRSLAIELGLHGITVNSVCPGMIETEIADDFALDEAFDAYMRHHVPLDQRFGQVEDCVGAYVFLASDAGRYITGQNIVVDGGILCEQIPRLQFMKPSSLQPENGKRSPGAGPSTTGSGDAASAPPE